MQVDEKEAKPAGTPTEPVSEPLHFTHSESEPLSPEEADEIFLKAVAEIPTQPLPKRTTQEETHALLFLYVLVLSFIAGSLIALITYPTVTVTLVPVQKSLQLTTTLAITTRSLPPVTLSKSLRAATTGKGHQDARAARGILMFYNGLFTTQALPIGTVFTGNDGVKVATDETVTLPAGNPPTYGEATVTSQAITPGAAGNIPAGDINAPIANGVLVKSSAFSGGQDAREYQAVAQSDLESLRVLLQQQLTHEMPRLFPLRSGEALQTTHCHFKSAPNHQVGEEARTVTVKATQTCAALAYNQDNLEWKATAAFTTTRPGTNYQLVGSVQTSIVTVSPFTIHIIGIWTYELSQDYKQFLAQQIAGDTPDQARAYLLATGFITQVRVPSQLPKDPGHIQFQILIGL